MKRYEAMENRAVPRRATLWQPLMSGRINELTDKSIMAVFTTPLPCVWNSSSESSESVSAHLILVS